MESHIFAFAFCSLFALGYAFVNPENFAFTDKVGQGNFAYAKLFAFTDDGSLYRLTKRSQQDPFNPTSSFAYNGIRNKFAKHRGNQDREFAFAFAKRSAPFAKRFAADGETDEWSDNTDRSINQHFAKFAKRSDDETAFAKFAKRNKFALVQRGLFA